MISFREALYLKELGFPQEPSSESLVYYVDLRDGSQRICRYSDLPKESSRNMVYVIPDEHELVEYILNIHNHPFLIATDWAPCVSPTQEVEEQKEKVIEI